MSLPPGTRLLLSGVNKGNKRRCQGHAKDLAKPRPVNNCCGSNQSRAKVPLLHSRSELHRACPGLLGRLQLATASRAHEPEAGLVRPYPRPSPPGEGGPFGTGFGKQAFRPYDAVPRLFPLLGERVRARADPFAKLRFMENLLSPHACSVPRNRRRRSDVER